MRLKFKNFNFSGKYDVKFGYFARPTRGVQEVLQLDYKEE